MNDDKRKNRNSFVDVAAPVGMIIAMLLALVTIVVEFAG